VQTATWTDAYIRAKFYYLRRVLHDWSLAESRKILARLAAAVGKGSRILIDDIALPDTNVRMQAAMQDLTLMIQMAGIERMQREWRELFDSVEDGEGARLLKVDNIQEYMPDTHGCVTVLKLLEK
jgi:demethylsterigmatocystin 6-O-methyltransferase